MSDAAQVQLILSVASLLTLLFTAHQNKVIHKAVNSTAAKMAEDLKTSQQTVAEQAAKLAAQDTLARVQTAAQQIAGGKS